MIFDLIDENKSDVPQAEYVGEAAGFLDLAAANTNYMISNENIDSKNKMVYQSYKDSVQSLKDLEGDNFSLPLSPYHHQKNFYDEHVKKMKIEKPEIYKSIPTLQEVEEKARERARQDRLDLEDVSERFEGGTASRLTATLAGGFAGSMVDPVNLATLAVGAGAGMGLLKTIAVEAAANAGVEGVTQQFVEKWQNELGEEYGLDDKVQAVGMAAIFGGGFAGLTKGLSLGARGIFSKLSKERRLTPNERVILKQMEQHQHFKETNPFRYHQKDTHFEIVSDVINKINNGERVDFKNRTDINNEVFNKIDTRVIESDSPTDIKVKNDIREFQEEELSLTEEQHILREEYIEEEIENMVYEVEQAVKGERVVVQRVNPENNQGFVKTDIFKQDSTFPSWYRDIKAKNKKDFKKIVKNKKGARYERIRNQAIERLERGYESRESGQVLPNEDFIAASTPKTRKDIDASFDFGDEIANRLDPRPKSVGLDVQNQIMREMESPEFEKASRAEFGRILESEPNARYEIEDDSGNIISVTAKQLKEQMESEERIFNEIQVCGIGG